MMNVLEVEGLGKSYPSFELKDVSFAIPEGRILGLVGANGAGKSTTLKAIVGLISAQGEVKICGIPFGDGRDCKRLIGYAGGGFRFYPNAKLKTIVKAVKAFYPDWQEERWERLKAQYRLDPEKRVRELSEGMKVKFSVALALSHGAKLLILDEPTSGLDPLSREEFCDCILELAKEGTSVLFSTHITGDLERVADDVVYLSQGKILFSGKLDVLKSRYSLGTYESAEQARQAGAIGIKEGKHAFEGLVPYREELRSATLDEIVVHLEREARKA